MPLLTSLYNYISSNNFILPFYHTVSDENLPHIKHLYKYRTVKEFEKDLDFLLKRYTPVDIETFHRQIKSGKSHKPSFLLSFDDGLSEIYNTIYPIIKQKGIPAVVFVNSAFVDNKSLFYRFKVSLLIEKIREINPTQSQLQELTNLLYKGNETDITHELIHVSYQNKDILDTCGEILEVDFNQFLETEKPYLEIHQLQELQENGITIGAHSIDHPEYRLLPEHEQISQTRESIRFVNSHIAPPIRTFSFPFTDYQVSKHFFKSIASDIDISFGCAGLKNELIPNHFQRIPIENYPDMESALQKESTKAVVRTLIKRNTIGR